MRFPPQDCYKSGLCGIGLIVWCLKLLSTVYCFIHSNYPWFPGVFLTNTPHSILSKLLGAFLHDDGFVGNQPVAWQEYCVEYRLKELQESMDRCTGCHDITEIKDKRGIKHNTMKNCREL